MPAALFLLPLIGLLVAFVMALSLAVFFGVLDALIGLRTRALVEHGHPSRDQTNQIAGADQSNVVWLRNVG